MSEHVVEGISSKSVLQQLIDTYTPIVAEARVHFNDDGVHVNAIDPSGVAFHRTHVEAGAFESYECPGEAVVGVNLNSLDDRLGVANSGDLAEFSLDMETRRLKLRIRNSRQNVALIDPDAIRQEPSIPDLDLPNSVTVEGRDLHETATVADLVSDHVELHAHPGEERVVFEAQGDTDESFVEFEGDGVIRADVTEETESLFSLDYFDELTSPMPADAEVTIRFGGEKPMMMEWEASDGYQSTTTFLAPRVQAR